MNKDYRWDIGRTWIIPNTNFAFVGIPKCGTSTIFKACKINIRHFIMYADKGDKIPFTIIRRPFDRIKSSYYELIKITETQAHHYQSSKWYRLYKRNQIHESVFEYISILEKGSFDMHNIPMTEYIVSDEIHVFKMFQIPALLEKFKAPYKHENKKQREYKIEQSFGVNEHRINVIYNDDFELYSKSVLGPIDYSKK